MNLKRFAISSLLSGAALALMIGPVGAQATTVTVGPHLPMDVTEGLLLNCEGDCVVANPTAPEGASHVAPVDGTILRWRLYRGSPMSPESPHPGFRLRVLTPFAGGYLAAGTSASAIPARFESVQTFSTQLPVKAGQLISLELDGDAAMSMGFSKAATSIFLEPPPADGQSTGEGPDWMDGRTFPFNADILPPPVIAGVSPGSGPIGGGTKVVVAGSNFAEVAGVEVGGQPAQYTVDSESQLTAIVPPGRRVGQAAVTVTTIAGRAETASAYRYEGCVVPKLKGKSLKATTTALGRRQCKLGEVRKRHGATAKTGRVKRQAPRRGTVLPPGAKVEVALGLNPNPPKARR